MIPSPHYRNGFLFCSYWESSHVFGSNLGMWGDHTESPNQSDGEGDKQAFSVPKLLKDPKEEFLVQSLVGISASHFLGVEVHDD